MFRSFSTISFMNDALPLQIFQSDLHKTATNQAFEQRQHHLSRDGKLPIAYFCIAYLAQYMYNCIIKYADFMHFGSNPQNTGGLGAQSTRPYHGNSISSVQSKNCKLKLHLNFEYYALGLGVSHRDPTKDCFPRVVLDGTC